MKPSPLLFALALALVFVISSCSNILCDADSVDVDGTCIKIADFCAEGETYVDGTCVKECDSGETRSCGTDEGECVLGTETCIDNAWGACEGAVAPTDELCDGLDNDCDGVADNSTFAEVCDGVDNDCDSLVDEGVMSVKEGPITDGVSAVVAVGDYFLVTRVGDNNDRIRSYDLNGEPTGLFEALGDTDSSFASMYESGGVVFVLYLDSGSGLALARVELSGAQPQVTHQEIATEATWLIALFGINGGRRTRIGRAGTSLFVIGGGPTELAMRTFNKATLSGFNTAQDTIDEISNIQPFDVGGSGIVGWVEESKVHVAGLFPEGTLVLDTEVTAGTALGLADGPESTTTGLALINTSGFLELYELDPQHRCVAGGLCNESLGTAKGPVALAYGTDAWVVAAGKKILAIAPDTTELFSHQTALSSPDDVQVAVNGTTTAIVQSTITQEGIGRERPDKTVLTFVGCLDD